MPPISTQKGTWKQSLRSKYILKIKYKRHAFIPITYIHAINIWIRKASSSMSHSWQGPLCRSSSMAMADDMPPEYHWWTTQILSNLVYPSSAGLPGHRLQSGPGGRPTDKSMCLQSTMCAGTSLSQDGQFVQKPRCDGRPGFHPIACTRPVRSCTSTLLMHLTLTFHVKGL